MGVNSVSVENHLWVTLNCNDKVHKEERIKYSQKSTKNRKEGLSEINEMKKKNGEDIEISVQFNTVHPRKWFQWNMFEEGNKRDELDFKSLCRMVLPKADLLGKEMRVKKNHFEEIK
eukprot:1702043-Ditylum_brightwellii.AAC.1